MKTHFLVYLLLFVSLLAVVAIKTWVSPSLVQAVICPTIRSSINVEGGLLSIVDESKLGRYAILDTTPFCIASSSASISQLQSIKSYADIKSIYLDQAKLPAGINIVRFTPGDKTENDINLNSNDTIYHIQGDLNLSGDITGTKIGVIFIDGNLTINPINKTFNYGTSTSGIIFIVQGEIRIGYEVTQVNAFMVTFGPFCSAYFGGCSEIQTQQLIINGSVVALDGADTSEDGDTIGETRFVRYLQNNSTQEAERINFDPKYLVVLRTIFARDSLIWSEIY